MRNFVVGALALALAACGGSDELMPPEPYELGNYTIPAGVSFPDDADLFGRAAQTLNGVEQETFIFKTGLSTEALLAFFDEKNMRLKKQEDDTYELYVGSLSNDTEIELRFDKLPAEASGETIYNLQVGSAVVDIPVTSKEAT
ncbi:MAG: hypothetical protein P8J20_03640 [Novosphingobium sp.]|nr:hypothetical protein [Novosphingobium sp.]